MADAIEDSVPGSFVDVRLDHGVYSFHLFSGEDQRATSRSERCASDP
jgi:hypothetical protein